jgi:O-antigen/teichoic acid export membrane protein
VSRSRPPGIAAQAALVFFGNSSGYIVAIITGIIVARTLGPAGKGVAAYAMLVMSVFTTFGSGLQSGIMHACGKNARPQLVAYGTALRLLGLAMLPAAAILATIAIVDPRHASFAYVACAVPFAVYCQIANAIFMLNGDIRSTVIQGAMPPFGVTVFTIPALTLFHGGLPAVLGIWSVMFAASACFAMIRLGRYLPAITLTSTPAAILDQACYGLKSGATSLAGFLNLRIDLFVVAGMLDARTLGVYSLAVATGEMMWQLSRPLAFSAMGRIAVADRASATALTCTITRSIVALEAALGTLLFFIAPAAITLVYGRAYAESGTIVRCLIPGVILYGAQMPLAFFLSVKDGKPLAALTVQLFSVIACAALSVLAIPHLNVIGAALATTATYGATWLATSLLFARSTGVPLARFTFVQGADIEHCGRMIQRRWQPRRVAVQ